VQLGFGDAPGADAGGTDADADMTAIHDSADPLQIDVPAPFGDIVGVADSVPKARTFATNFTDSCHFSNFSNLFNQYTKLLQGAKGPQSRNAPPFAFSMESPGFPSILYCGGGHSSDFRKAKKNKGRW
jgi:hypothetical protein